MRNTKRPGRQVVDSKGLVNERNELIARIDWLRNGDAKFYTRVGLTAAERERAAHWLGEFMPETSHDERYEMLFGD